MISAQAAPTPIAYDESFEVMEQDEEAIERDVVKTLREISDTTFADTKQGLRSVHAKSHGLLTGELRVLELPLPFSQGLFAAPRTYAVMIRLSTSPGDVLDDRVSTPRGFAMKVLGVEGERDAHAQERTTQDFLLVDAADFLAPNAQKFAGNLKLLASTTDKVPRLKRAFSSLLRGAEGLLETVGGKSATLIGLGGHPHTHPLGETYFGEVPFMYGLHMAKWCIAPVSPTLLALKDATVDLDDKPDGLREAVSDYFAVESAQWELRVQLCTDIATMPIEDASAHWPEDQSPFVPVARITVPPQASWSDSLSAAMDDGLSFSPWNCLAAHRPLGSINRVRRAAYAGSVAARAERGRCPVSEPRQRDKPA